MGTKHVFKCTSKSIYPYHKIQILWAFKNPTYILRKLLVDGPCDICHLVLVRSSAIKFSTMATENIYPAFLTLWYTFNFNYQYQTKLSMALHFICVFEVINRAVAQ